MTTLNLGFFASHGGTNMQAIIDACKKGQLNAKPCVVISNNSDSIALQRAEKEGIPFYHLSSKTHPDFTELDRVILDVLKKHNVNLVILAGYMKKLGIKTLEAYKGKILNIHPALLPKFGGKGMYGKYVHEAVLAAGENITGVTVHIVNEEYDSGHIVNQCQMPVHENDTVDTLSARVLEREHEFFVETLQKISEGKIKLG
ncbi:MAG: phosphoribosylglycinamide formyltransferase [bacterium]|nr:phosphoribosylglycinamide formyltransferase [bacterium]